ncbi:hypothetical protein C8R43DRAFT_1051816 [Mycena crocata]|nr:hypothetical protein C8R43DRAFT_1051816 [Mycena crocata]
MYQNYTGIPLKALVTDIPFLSLHSLPTPFLMPPRPLDFRTRESADARSALMAKIPQLRLEQLPLDLDGAARSRRLQAERPRPYCATPRPKRRLLADCRKNGRVAPNLGWGAFLKGETLITSQGAVIREAKGLHPPSPCARQRISEDYSGLLWQQPTIGVAGSEHNCYVAKDDSALDCSMPYWPETSQGAKYRRCSSVSKIGHQFQDSTGDCEMLDYSLFEQVSTPPDVNRFMSDRLCVKAAEEMFTMFIDEDCMEEDCGQEASTL